MSNFAFTSPKRTRDKKIYAKECTHDDWHYYCPNKYCNAHLSIIRRKGSATPYFSVKRGDKSHEDKCPYYSKNGNVQGWDTKKCSENEIFGLFEKNSSSNRVGKYDRPENKGSKQYKRRISTITALYTYCIQYGIDSYIEGLNSNVGNYVCCSENGGNFNEINGLKVVEIRYGRKPDEEVLTDVAYYPYWNNDENRIIVDIMYENFEMYEYFKKIFNNHPKDLFIIGGNFIGEGPGRTSVLIRRKSQIHHFKGNNQ